MRARSHRTSWSAWTVILTLTSLSASALAYIDPGSGSYVFQLIVGAMVGSAVAIKVFWRRVATFFSGLIRKQG